MVSLPVPVLLKHECNVSVRHDIMGGFQNASLRGFYFQFVVSERVMLYYFSNATYDWVHQHDVVGEQVACGRFVVKVEDMSQCEVRAVHVITSMLRTINVTQTEQPEMVWKIYSTVRSLCRQVEDISDVRIPVLVDIVRVFQQAVMNPFGEPAPAARSAVAALEKVRLKPKETCSICLEGLVKATRMPCSHVFHERCIVRWLKRSNECPLCRFQLPSDN
nr:E3 ubiquitin-protein ligase RNF181-like [Ipomoea batatas]